MYRNKLRKTNLLPSNSRIRLYFDSEFINSLRDISFPNLEYTLGSDKNTIETPSREGVFDQLNACGFDFFFIVVIRWLNLCG